MIKGYLHVQGLVQDVPLRVEEQIHSIPKQEISHVVEAVNIAIKKILEQEIGVGKMPR